MNISRKIRYRLVYNYANRLNRQGLAPVSVECRIGNKKIYLSTKVLIAPDQWSGGLVVNHDGASKINEYIVKFRNAVEQIELNALLKERHLSLSQLKMAIKCGLHESASLKDFTLSVINNSDRKDSTKRGYEYLINELEERYGKMTLEDITYDWILKWKRQMHDSSLAENTIKGRLKSLHTITNEAIKRNLITDDPFKFVTIGNMTPKAVWLNMREIKRIERVTLTGKEALVRDLFILGCYCGLRWSDLSTLEEATIKDGLLRKMMKKTNHEVVIPIKTLYWGKGMDIINRYPDIRKLSHCCCNATANKVIKGVAIKAGVNKPVSFHWARKSFSSNLQLLGMSLGDVSNILGHAGVEVTSKHYSFSQEQSAAKQSRKIFRKKSSSSEE